MVTFGFVSWGAVSGRKLTSSEIYGMRVGEMILVVKMNEMLSIESV